MTTITRPIVRRTPQGYAAALYPEGIMMLADPRGHMALLRRDIVRQTADSERGDPIVVELRPRTVVVRLKGHRQGMEIAYAALTAEMKVRKVSMLTYGALYWILLKRIAWADENRERLNRRTA